MRNLKLVILVYVLNLFLICFGCSSNTSDNKSDGDFDQSNLENQESDNGFESSELSEYIENDADHSEQDSEQIEADNKETDSAYEVDITEENHEVIKRMVIAGDSWSRRIIAPTQSILKERGYEVTVTGGSTAIDGTTVEEWVQNKNNKLDKLYEALDKEPKAELLILVIGVNDVDYKISGDFLHRKSKNEQNKILTQIVTNIKSLVSGVLTPRPYLKIAIIGYDYIHSKSLQRFKEIDDLHFETHNEILIDLEQRKRNLATLIPGVEYAHNLGVMQYSFGDKPTPPFYVPPFEYQPHSAARPGYAPKYDPFPGGLRQFPSPYEYIKDGIHPNPKAFLAIMNNSFDQGLENLVKGKNWVD